MRRLLALLLSLVVIVGALVGLELVIRTMVQEQLEDRVSRALDAPTAVRLHGWPVTWHLLQGSLERVELTARDVPLGHGDAALTCLAVQLDEVAIRWEDLAGTAEDLPPADAAVFEARLDQPAVQGLVDVGPDVVDVSLRDDLVVLDLAGLVRVEAAVEADDGLLLVRPRGTLAELLGLHVIPIDLSDQPGGPHVREARVSPDGVVLIGTLEGLNPADRD